MDIFPQAIVPVMLLKPKRFGGARGYFSKLYSRRAIEGLGLAFEFVQDNVSLSVDVGTVRELHFQTSRPSRPSWCLC